MGFDSCSSFVVALCWPRFRRTVGWGRALPDVVILSLHLLSLQLASDSCQSPIHTLTPRIRLFALHGFFSIFFFPASRPFIILSPFFINYRCIHLKASLKPVFLALLSSSRRTPDCISYITFSFCVLISSSTYVRNHTLAPSPVLVLLSLAPPFLFLSLTCISPWPYEMHICLAPVTTFCFILKTVVYRLPLFAKGRANPGPTINFICSVLYDTIDTKCAIAILPHIFVLYTCTWTLLPT